MNPITRSRFNAPARSSISLAAGYRVTAGLGLAILTLALAGCAAERIDPLTQLKTYHAARESSSSARGPDYDSIRINPGETKFIADLQGPGCITHIWFTHLYPARGALRKLVIRAWFDGAETPCIEAPLGDFFGLGNSNTYSYASERLAVGTNGGLNSFWPMPFRHRARIAITNDGRQPCDSFFYYVDYEKLERLPRDTAYFHAHYRQAMPCIVGQPYTVLEANGRGHYAGCNLSVEQLHEGWWGEGNDRFFIDGATSATFSGTGSEDYFSGAWCYGHEFAFPYFGMPFRGRLLPDGAMKRYTPDVKPEEARDWQWPNAWQKGDLWNVYRYPLESPVPFRTSLRFDIDHGFLRNERHDAYSSVAYWYQDHPHGLQPALPPWKERIPYYLRLQERGEGLFEAEDFVDDATLSAGSLTEGGSTFWGKGFWSRDGQLEWRPRATSDTLTLPVPIAKSGNHSLTLVGTRTRSGGQFEILLNGGVILPRMDLYQGSVFPDRQTYDLGTFDLAEGTSSLTFVCAGRDPESEGRSFQLDTIRFRPESPPAESPAENR